MKLNSIRTNNRVWNYQTDDTNLFEGHYANGVTARILTSVVNPVKTEQLFIQGRDGSIFLDRKQVILYNIKGKIIDIDNTPYNWVDAYKKQLTCFLDLINKKNKQYFNPMDLEIMKMVDMKH